MNNGFKYFPEKLYIKPVKIIAALSSAVKTFGMSRPSEIFYSIKNGNWNDVSVWQTVSGRVGRLPTANDDVYIHHTVDVNLDIIHQCNSLSINPTGFLTATYRGGSHRLIVNGDFKNYGSISLAMDAFILAGFNNIFKGSDFSTITLNTNLTLSGNNPLKIQRIPSNAEITSPISIICNGASPKHFVGDTTLVNFNCQAGGICELNSYNVTTTGAFACAPTLSSLGDGLLLVIGTLTILGTISISDNVTRDFECRGNIAALTQSGTGNSYTGLGTFRLTTNNKTMTSVTGGGFVEFFIPLIVDAGITVTHSNVGFLRISNYLNGVDGASTFVNQGTVYFMTQPSVVNSMTVGVFDRTTFANTVGYVGNYSVTLPYTTYSSLLISGTGTKTQASGANTLSGNLTISNNGRLDSAGNTTVGGTTTMTTGISTLNMLTYDWTFTGACNINGGTPTLTKTGSGNVLFIGYAWFLNYVLTFSGNPNVEVRGGLRLDSPSAQNLGLGTWNFSTNNQVMTINNVVAQFQDILITGAIILTNQYNTGIGRCQINNTLNGTVAGSTFRNQHFLNFNTLTDTMSIGVLDLTTFITNVVNYNYNGNVTISYLNFQGLEISGTGTKTASGNTVVGSNLLVSSGTFQLSTFDLTVTGTSIVTPTFGFLAKNGAGSILFIGNFQPGNGAGQTDFRTGNPTVELRGGLTITNSNPNPNTIYTGLGQWTFTTNNQSMNSWNTNFPINFDAPITIASGITLTVAASMYAQFSNTINGASVTSNLTNRGFIGFHTLASVSSMTTGTFDISTFTNTVLYTGNYSVTLPYSTYSSLTISGTGTKTLAANTTLSANLLINNGGQLECSTHNLTVNGTSNINPTVSRYPFVKSGAGSLLFVGNVNLNTINGSYALDLSGGNPTVEFRNGITVGYAAILANWSRTGTGQWSFTTNNQTALIQALTYNCPVLISGAITVTMANNALTTTFTNTINGNDVNSRLIIGASNVINYQSTTQPMATGVLDTSTNANTWIYGLNNQDIKGSPTISPKQVYRNLTLNGTGVKTLQGYVSVLNTYTLTAPATLANNGFTLTNP
jgi:hypothetical protein